MPSSDPRLTYIVSSTQAIAEHARMQKELGEKRRRALLSLMDEGWTVTGVAAETDIPRPTLYKAAGKRV